MRDIKRHLDALRSAMGQFGEDFDLDVFARAHASSDPDELNRVKAVERGVDQLYNFMAELARFGLELAGELPHGSEINAGRDFYELSRLRILSSERVTDLRRLQALRRLIVHEYDQATAEQIHEAARSTIVLMPVFYDAYLKWLRTGFSSAAAAPR